jgi:hypothetical protein
MRFRYNKRTHSEDLFVKIDENGVWIPAIKTIPHTGVCYTQDDIEKVFFNYSTGRHGRTYFTSTEFILKDGRKIKLSIFLVPVSAIKKRLESLNYRFFAKKDNTVRKLFILLAVIMLFFVLFFIFMLMPDISGGLFDF